MRKKIWVVGIAVLVLFSANAVLADFVNVPASAFGSKLGEADYNLATGGVYIYKVAGSFDVLYAPVSLPDGAVIKSVRLLYMDNTDAGYVDCDMFRINMFNGSRDTIFHCTTNGVTSSSSVQSVVDSSCSPAASYRKVYNNVLEYALRLYFTEDTSNLRVYGVTIEYQ